MRAAAGVVVTRGAMQTDLNVQRKWSAGEN